LPKRSGGFVLAGCGSAFRLTDSDLFQRRRRHRRTRRLKAALSACRARDGQRRIECPDGGLAARPGAALVAFHGGESAGAVGQHQGELLRPLRSLQDGVLHLGRHRNAAPEQIAGAAQQRDTGTQATRRQIARIGKRVRDQAVAGAPHPHDIDLGFRHAPRQAKEAGRRHRRGLVAAPARKVAANGLRQFLRVARQRRIGGDRQGQPMTARVPRHPRLAGRRLRAGAGARIAAIGGALALTGHGAPAALPLGYAARTRRRRTPRPPHHRMRQLPPRAPRARRAPGRHDGTRSRGARRRGGLPPA
jgi:hypothetical protein